MHTAAKTMQTIKVASLKATSKLDALEEKYQYAHKHFKDLSDNDLALLAGILAHQPPATLPKTSSQHTAYATITKSDIDKLPSHLRSYPSSLIRYVARISEDTPDLCSLHHKLSRHQMDSILRFIRREIDAHIPVIHRDLRDAGMVSVEVHELFQRVREVSAMWTNTRKYIEVFEEEPKPQWTPQKDGCAACMLSRLGGEPDVLVALKAVMITWSRTNAIYSSRRHTYLDSLILNGFVAVEADALMQKAISLGAEVRYQWRGLIAKQREKKRDEKAVAATKGKGRVVDVVTQPTDDGGEDIYNDINDIINEYHHIIPLVSNSTSGPSQSSDSLTASSIYTTSIAHLPPALNPRHPPGKPHHTKSYSDSPPYRGANSYAMSYQNVLGDSGPYQRTHKQEGGKERLETTKTFAPRPRPQTQISPLTPKKSPADSEGTTWGGFLESINQAQGKGIGK